eukprot:COSAG01_NODE_3835_length_5649_cov_36.487474_7_plen_130_part_00
MSQMLAMAPWQCTKPLGSPVEPDVKATNSWGGPLHPSIFQDKNTRYIGKVPVTKQYNKLEEGGGGHSPGSWPRRGSVAAAATPRARARRRWHRPIDGCCLPRRRLQDAHKRKRTITRAPPRTPHRQRSS